jgi:repressor of nif and glnA expression
MASLDESHDERILRILRDAKKPLSAQEVTDEIHKQLGSGGIYNVKWVEARLSALTLEAQIENDGDQYRFIS